MRGSLVARVVEFPGTDWTFGKLWLPNPQPRLRVSSKSAGEDKEHEESEGANMSAHHDSFLTDRSGAFSKGDRSPRVSNSKIAAAPDKQEDELATEEVLLNVSHSRNLLCDLDKRPRAAWVGHRFRTAK